MAVGPAARLLDNHEVLATEREPEGLGEIIKRELHEVQRAVPKALQLDPTLL